MTRSETAAEIGRGGLWLLEKWARDTLVTGAVLFSVFAILAGVAGDGGATWLVIGLVVGLAGIVPALRRHEAVVGPDDLGGLPGLPRRLDRRDRRGRHALSQPTGRAAPNRSA